jgi:HPr kinase/phosphorylase
VNEDAPPPTVHGTVVALDGLGVLLIGPSGSGKSDLALRLLEAGWSLVADDRVVIDLVDGRPTASAPALLAGLIEARGVGILPVPCLSHAEVVLVVLLTQPGLIERCPEPETYSIENVRISAMRLAPFEVSATMKLRLALRQAVGR